jgi:cytochrome P450
MSIVTARTEGRSYAEIMAQDTSTYAHPGVRARLALGGFRVVQSLVSWQWPMRLLDPLMQPYNPFLDTYRTDPYPALHVLRSRAPVCFHRVLRSWLLSRHADVVRALRDPRLSVDRTQTSVFKAMDFEHTFGPALAKAVTRSLLMVDPPDHTRMRRLVNKAFTPRVVQRMEPRIQTLVDELLDDVERRGRFELIRDFAYPLPVVVIAEMLGIPTEDRDRFKRWSDKLAVLLDPFELTSGIEPAKVAFAELQSYFEAIFEDRRRRPRDDLISSLVAVEDEGEHLSTSELFAITTLILGAGHETTTNLIGNAVIALLRNPEQRRRFAEDDSIATSAVEEFLRYDSPVHLTDRVALEDFDIDGHRIQAGQLVGILLAGANRDPDVFDDPDRLQLDRADNHHVAFGGGVHFCLGASLARLEARVALTTLVRRFPRLQSNPEAVSWKRSLVLRGVEALPLRVA